MERLRVFELRRSYRLLSELWELGDDWMVWFTHMAEALCQMLDASVFVGGETQWHAPSARYEVLAAVAAGFTLDGNRRWIEPVSRESVRAGELFPNLDLVASRLTTYSRRQPIGEPNWIPAGAYPIHSSGRGLDDALISLLPIDANGETSIITLHRHAGQRDFSPRDKLQLHLFHRELGHLLRRDMLFRAAEPGVSALSPRLRQTLYCLLEGDSEKRVAARLRLSEATVHQYVGALYQHFRVNTRASLLAYFMRRARRQEYAATLPPNAEGE